LDIQAFLDYKLLGRFPVDDVLIGLSILLCSIYLRAFIASMILKPLRFLSGLSSNKIDDTLVDVIETPLKLFIVLVGSYVATLWLPFPNIDKAIIIIVKSVSTIMIFWILIRFVNKFSTIFKFFSHKLGRKVGHDIQNFILKSIRILLMVLCIMALLQGWGINVSAFVASLGLGGLAVALAAKDAVANLFGSLVIFSDRPFQVGDWIETPDVDGIIEEVGVRSTKIRNHAQALVSVPNSIMANITITNWSRMGKRRVRTRIGLTYDTSAEQMQAVIDDIKEMLQNHPQVHKEVIVVNFDEFEASALSILLNFFTNTIVTTEYLQVRQDVNIKIMQIVAKHGASFAFPSQSLYVESLPK